MSVENVKAFMAKAKSDPDLKAKFKEAGSMDEIVQLGKENGYDFSAADIEAAGKELLSSGEVSQEDLEKNLWGWRYWGYHHSNTYYGNYYYRIKRAKNRRFYLK